MTKKNKENLKLIKIIHKKDNQIYWTGQPLWLKDCKSVIVLVDKNPSDVPVLRHFAKRSFRCEISGKDK